MTKFNVVVIGLGLIGMKYGLDSKRKQPASHISAIIKNPDLDLIGVCDTDKNARDLFIQKYGNKINIFDNYSKLIEQLITKKITCSIIVIATPDSTHSEILQLLIQNLKDQTKPIIIFCEKPLTPDVSSAERIKQMVKNQNLMIVVNHSRRWSRIWKEAYGLLKEIGDVKNAAFYFSTSPENKKIIQIRDGIHIADLINWFGIMGKTKINRLDVPYLIYDFYLWGTKGKIEILNNGEILNFFKIKESSRYEGFQEIILDHTKKINESILANTYEEFVNFLNGNVSSLTTDIDDAVSALQVFEKYVYDDELSKI